MPGSTKLITAHAILNDGLTERPDRSNSLKQMCGVGRVWGAGTGSRMSLAGELGEFISWGCSPLQLGQASGRPKFGHRLTRARALLSDLACLPPPQLHGNSPPREQLCLAGICELTPSYPPTPPSLRQRPSSRGPMPRSAPPQRHSAPTFP